MLQPGATKVKWYGKEVELGSREQMGARLKVIAIAVFHKMSTSFTPRPPGVKGKAHIPSQPGQPPAVDTGNLKSSRVWELDNGASSKNGGSGKGATIARIGVPRHAIYGVYLESGTKRGLKPRPWMVPALMYVVERMK